jgi:serine/threonine protein kinase
VAIKIVDKIHAPSLIREVYFALTQIETWRQLHHPNIAQLYEVLSSESKIYMVTEYCNGGELLDYITHNGRMDDRAAQTVKVFVQIAEAVQKCHDKNFTHRDLKLENILLTNDLQVKLIDFGFTRLYDEKVLLDTYCGSSAYAAPEIVAGQKYSGPEADIWSLGVVLYTIVCGYLPFDADTEFDTHQQIKEISYVIPSFLQPGTLF